MKLELGSSRDAAPYSNGASAEKTPLSILNAGHIETVNANGSGSGVHEFESWQRDLLSELHEAHLRNEFFVEYQPIFECTGRCITAVEALLRWRRDNGEIVQPDIFIPVAEESQLVSVIGRWVFEQVCRDLLRLRAGGLDGLQVHINMAISEFLDPALPSVLTNILERACIAPGQICLEVTERVDLSVGGGEIPVMHMLRRLGFDISLDDFGTGYSTLSLLQMLPVSSIKIDQIFVAKLSPEEDDCDMVRSMLDLARDMDLIAVAEGVETEAQLAILQRLGAPLIQGYLLGRPSSIARLIAEHGKWSDCTGHPLVAPLRTTQQSCLGDRLR